MRQGARPCLTKLKEDLEVMVKADRHIGIILIIFSSFMYIKTSQFPPAMLGTLGAGFFPKILFTLLALTGIGLIITSFRKKNEGSTAGQSSLKTVFQDYFRVIWSFTLIFFYIIAMYYFGYLWATLGFMISLMWFLGPRKVKNLPLLIIISCGVTFIIYYSFLKLLQIFLPEGTVF